MTTKKIYRIYGKHKTCGIFNEWTQIEKVAKKIACSLIKSNYFTYVSIIIEEKNF